MDVDRLPMPRIIPSSTELQWSHVLMDVDSPVPTVGLSLPGDGFNGATS